MTRLLMILLTIGILAAAACSGSTPEQSGLESQEAAEQNRVGSEDRSADGECIETGWWDELWVPMGDVGAVDVQSLSDQEPDDWQEMGMGEYSFAELTAGKNREAAKELARSCVGKYDVVKLHHFEGSDMDHYEWFFRTKKIEREYEEAWNKALEEVERTMQQYIEEHDLGDLE